MRDIINSIKTKLSEIYPEQETQNLLRILMEHVTGQNLPTLLSDKSKKITAVQKQNIDEIIVRLLEHEPIQHIIGETEFFGLRFFVDKNVLIPRPETEELVELILNENLMNNPDILDIGTGSGAIAIALAKHKPNAAVSAWEISHKAIEVAIMNSKINSVDVDFEKVDILHDFPTGKKYDIIVSNPPYIMEEEKESMEKNVLEYEPHSALFVPDNNPLLFYERIANIAKSLFNKKGMLYFEINQRKGQETIQLLKENGYINVELIKDISGNDRIVKGEYKNNL